MSKFLKKIFSDEVMDAITVPCYACIGYIVLTIEVVSFLTGWELLLFELIPTHFPNLFILDLLTTTFSCGLLMATIRSLYYANRVKSYANPEDVKAGYSQLAESENKKSHPRYCKKCKLFKGNSFHHCSVCNKCVYEMDHHCFFLANCVGGKNYKFFLSYVVLSLINCSIVFVGVFPFVLDLFHLNFEVLGQSLLLFQPFEKVGIVKTIYCTIAATMFGVFTAGLMASHFFYMANGTSFLDEKFGKKKNSHSAKEFALFVLSCGYKNTQVKASIKKGFTHIFGDSWKNLFWPDV